MGKFFSDAAISAGLCTLMKRLATLNRAADVLSLEDVREMAEIMILANWQKIEDAPEDEKEFFLARDAEGWIGDFCVGAMKYMIEEAPPVTHFMPLPPQPEEKG